MVVWQGQLWVTKVSSKRCAWTISFNCTYTAGISLHAICSAWFECEACACIAIVADPGGWITARQYVWSPSARGWLLIKHSLRLAPGWCSIPLVTSYTTRCTYLQCIYASRTSPWPLNQHMWISRHGMCFWDGRSWMCNEVWKVWEGRQSVLRITLKEFENVSTFSNHTEHEDMVVSQDDHALICFARCCCSLSYSSFSTWTSRHWRYIYALYSPLFSRQALPCSRYNFCHFDVVTMRPLAPLQRWER